MKKQQTFEHNGDEIKINGEVFSLEIFKSVFPKYKLPKNCISQTYIKGIRRSAKESIDGRRRSITMDPVWKEGDKYIRKRNDLKQVDRQSKADKIEKKKK